MSALDTVPSGGPRSAVARHPQPPSPLDGRLDTEVVEEPHDDWRRWLGTIAATTFLVLAVGGVTRLTHSGLSIVDCHLATAPAVAG